MNTRQGFLIHNEYKDNPDQPDYWGVVTIGGCDYTIGGWRGKTKAGRPKIDLRLSIKHRQTVQDIIDQEGDEPMTD